MDDASDPNTSNRKADRGRAPGPARPKTTRDGRSENGVAAPPVAGTVGIPNSHGASPNQPARGEVAPGSPLADATSQVATSSAATSNSQSKPFSSGRPDRSRWVLRDAAGRPLDRFEAELELYRQFLDFGTEVPPHDAPDVPPGFVTPVQLWKQMAIWQERIMGAWAAKQISVDAARRLMTDIGKVLMARIDRSEKGSPISFSEGGFATATDPLRPGFQRVLTAVTGTRLDTPTAKVDLLRRVTDLSRATDCAAIADPSECEATITSFADDAIRTFMEFHQLDPALLDKGGPSVDRAPGRSRRTNQNRTANFGPPGAPGAPGATPPAGGNPTATDDGRARTENLDTRAAQRGQSPKTPVEPPAAATAAAQRGDLPVFHQGAGGSIFIETPDGDRHVVTPDEIAGILGISPPERRNGPVLAPDDRIIRPAGGGIILFDDETSAQVSGVSQGLLRTADSNSTSGEFQPLEFDGTPASLINAQVVITEEGVTTHSPEGGREMGALGMPVPIDPAELGIDLGPYPIQPRHPVFIDPRYIIDRRGITRSGAGVEVTDNRSSIRITPANADVPIVAIPMRDLNAQSFSRLHPNAHQYHVATEVPGTHSQDQLATFGAVLIGSPTLNDEDKPATIEGTQNDANPTDSDFRVEFAGRLGPNDVRSYVVPSTDPNRSDVVVNYTTPNHALYPGYVMRFAERDDQGRITLHTYGEGIGDLQSPNFVMRTPLVPDTYLLGDWERSHGGIIEEAERRIQMGGMTL